MAQTNPATFMKILASIQYICEKHPTERMPHDNITKQENNKFFLRNIIFPTDSGKVWDLLERAEKISWVLASNKRKLGLEG
jgi:hypothetical protein